jgi:hypothetical protein
MKITKLVKPSLGFALMAVLLISVASCKKSKTQPNINNSLYGGWYEVKTVSNMQRTVYFEPNTNKFIMTIAQYSTNQTTVSTYTGAFVVKSDSL